MSIVLQGVGLGRTYGFGKHKVRALEGAGVELHEGRTLGVIGESGSGKSTLGDIMGGLLAPTSGEVFYRGAALSKLDRRTRAKFRRDVQFVFQDSAASLDPRYTVARAVAEPLDASLDAPDGAERDRAVMDMLGRVGLSAEVAQRRTGELSGGQRQRVAIARALVGRPAVVVCDEPTSALDVSVQAQVLNLLRDLQDDLGCSYLFISHDMGVVSYMAHDVAVIHKGRIVEQGPTDQVFSQPKDAYTRLLLQASEE
jgi:peptide/nickel transport system ATP-binding protein